MSRILVLSGSHLSQNPRALKEAATLAAAGHEVTLLNVSVRADLAAADDRLTNGQRFHRETLDLAHSASALFSRFRTRFARSIARRLGRSSPSALGPARLLLARARAVPSDLLIAHTEIALWIAQQLAGEGRRVAVDLEDWHSEDLLPADRRDRPIDLLRAAERFALRHAAYVSVPSAAMAGALRAAYAGNPPVVVRNSFPLQPDPRTLQPSASAPRLVWFSQTIGPGRGLEEFISIWNRVKTASTLTLIGHLRAGYRATLETRLAPERRGQFSIRRAAASSELPATIAEFDVGLALEPMSPPNKDLTISNKVFQYLNAGLAVIATPTAGQREIFGQAPGIGILLPAAADAAVAQVEAFISSPDKLRPAQIAARAAAEREFCWEKEAPRLVAAVDAALQGKKPSA